MFAALPGLRNDRSMTAQHLAADQPAKEPSSALAKARVLDLPNMKAALAVLETADFPEQQSTALRTEVDRFAALQRDTEAAIKSAEVCTFCGIGRCLRQNGCRAPRAA